MLRKQGSGGAAFETTVPPARLFTLGLSFDSPPVSLSSALPDSLWFGLPNRLCPVKPPGAPPTGWRRRRAPTCCSTPTTRSIGIPGAPRRSPRPRRENKPIFLSIGYSSCYWCHVMERESFMDPEIAKAINAAVRGDQGRSRGAARRRPGLHAAVQVYRSWPARRGRLADVDVPDARRPPLLRRDVLPAQRPRRPAWALGRVGRVHEPGDQRPRSEKTRRPSGRRRRRKPARPGRLVAPASSSTRDWLEEAGTRWPTSSTPSSAASASTPPTRAAQVSRAGEPALPARPASSRRAADAAGPRAMLHGLDLRRDGPRRHPRPPGRRLSPLQHRPLLERPALREDALRQRRSWFRSTPRPAS